MITPWGTDIANDAVVISLIVKVSQGQTARDGDAWLYHDGPTDDGLQLGGQCELISAVGDSRTICEIPIAPGDLDPRDSLSVFVKTDGGNFSGASACVLIAPDGL